MKELFQKHRKRIIGGVIAICLLGGGGYYYVHTNDSAQTQQKYTTGRVERLVLVLRVPLILLIMWTYLLM